MMYNVIKLMFSAFGRKHMKIVNLGYNYKHPQDFCINRPNGIGNFLLLILKSDAYLVLNNKKEYVTANSIIFYKKGTPQFFGAVGKEYVNDWITFEANNEDIAKFAEFQIPFEVVLSIGHTTQITNLIRNMYAEWYSKNLHKELSLNLYFDLILFKISELLKASKSVTYNAHYNALIDLRTEIYLNPQRKWNIADISQKMHLSRFYLQHLYSSFFNSSIMEDVSCSRIEHSKYLLSSTDASVKSIAQLCGYDNDVHFMRIFKKRVGVTPSQFRKQARVSNDEILTSKTQNPFCI